MPALPDYTDNHGGRACANFAAEKQVMRQVFLTRSGLTASALAKVLDALRGQLSVGKKPVVKKPMKSE